MANLKKAARIFSFVKPHRLPFFIGLMFLLLGSLVGLAFPALIGKLTDAANGKQLEAPYNDMNKIFIALILVFVIQAAFGFVRVYTFVQVGERTLADIRRKVYAKLLSLPMDFFAENRVGELNSRITLDLAYIQDTITTTSSELIRQFVMIIGGVIMLFTTTSAKLTGLMLIIFPVLIAVAIIFGSYIRKVAKKAQQKMADNNVVMEESLHSIFTVKSFTNEWYELNRFSANLKEVVRYGIKGGLFRALFSSFILLVVFGSIIGIIFVGFKMVNTGEISIGTLVSFITFSSMVGASMGSLSTLIADFQRAIGATERVFDLLDEQPEVTSEHRPVIGPNDVINGDIDINNLHFAYKSRKDQPVFTGLSLNIKEGSSLALVGPSGIGKSTLASILMRFYQPDSGELLINGKDVNEFHLSAYRAQVGVVPQEVLLFGGTIYENILYGNPDASKEEVMEAARLANAHEFISGFTEGYETVVGERGMKLSGGQRQRIAIARAILKNPKLLILDEATSSLDNESERLVQEALNTLMKGRTTVVIAHRLSTIREADCIAFIKDGKVAELGTHDELMQIEGGLFRNFQEIAHG